jgi:alkanesulfonate monooxygenase SsuD/methylene tetrahydromethanopterin reductase-like flavin-dependent oxidoreductase (luciferase family)
MARVSTQLVEWASASRPLGPGEETGDACLVRTLPGGALVAVVDGLGHGVEAAAAARRALALLTDAEAQYPVAVVKRCHDGLRRSRGVVMSLAWFDGGADAMTWAGVGNVQGMLQRVRVGAGPSQESLMLRGGVVGREIPPLYVATLPVAAGDTLVFATDGIRPRFVCEPVTGGTPQQVAERILAEYRTGADDALVVVVRYRGGWE